MHELASLLETLTRGTGWEALRYAAISTTLAKLTAYCPVCECQTRVEARTK